MPRDSGSLKWSLRQFGYSEPAIEAAWPGWWTDELEASPTAQAELRFSVARKLGLDPRRLVKDEEPRFVWKDFARFKHLSTESTSERDLIGGYGVSVARALSSGAESVALSAGTSAADLRASILANQPFIRLADLLGLCWAVGISVIHLRVFPLVAKRMYAMSVRLRNHAAILIGRDAEYPAPIAYYLAHEIGHIALGHVGGDPGAVVDLSVPLEDAEEGDAEERDADRFALQLLTGRPDTSVATTARRYTSRQIAETVLQAAPELRIEPGTLALCFGHNMKDWPRAMAAMRYIYAAPHPVWLDVNAAAEQQLVWAKIPDDSERFLRNVMDAPLK